VRRLSEILVSFGKAARDAAEPLRTSPNPAVRRTAIHLLRAGGNDALGPLAEFIDDPEATVQREAVRALAIIGTPDAYATLQKVLTSGSDRQREAIMAALGSMRDERAVPLFCHMVGNDAYRKSLRSAWLAAVDGLAATGGPDAIAALREALQRGEWWAPRRTAALRKAVATALRRIGSPEAVRALESASEHGSSGARAAAREQLAHIRSAPPKSARRR
jgi:HEAT repeat protein